MNLKNQFFGEIEMDESYFGAKRKRGYHGKLNQVEELKNSLYLAFLKEMVVFIPR